MAKGMGKGGIACGSTGRAHRREAKTDHHHSHRSRQGYTLLTVLVVIAIISITSYSLIQLADFAIPASKKEEAKTREYLAAKGGINYLIGELKKEESPQTIQVAERIELGETTVALSLSDEGSLINVNAATEKLLRGLDLGKGQIDALLDWRDLDGDLRGQGAEAAYYLALDPPQLIRNGLIPTKEELLLLKGWHDEERLINSSLTVWGPLNVNTMSYEAFDALLAKLEVDTFAAAVLVNDFIVAKSEGALWRDLESFFGSLPSLGPSQAQKLEPHLTAEPVVNINTVPERVLAAWCYYLDLGSDLASWIVRRREGQPFSDLTELRDKVPQSIQGRLPLYFTTESRIFSLTATAGKTTLRAIVERDEEEIKVLAWYRE